ncbi:indolepyruvate ferredoxin oxidoreductase subunit alpha [Oscillospiraceae bacterium PP1C4]
MINQTKRFLMGNEAIAYAAIHAGVNVVSGYPGTPSTEILETVAKNNDGTIYVEWSVNEKVALEVAAGASYAGARTLVTMKQVGLNVASDPLMSLAYVGVKGGMVIVVADDPGPISSQTEQDTRMFASFCKIPVFDPTSPEEAYKMIGDAFACSEKYHTPVFLRPTTRVCHGYSQVEFTDNRSKNQISGFVKDSKWVIFPRLSYQNHIKIEERNPMIADEYADYSGNRIEGTGKVGIATGGISYAYTKEALKDVQGDLRLLKIATPFPFPTKLALQFLKEVDEVLVIEELEPVIERELIYLCGKYYLPVKINGKLTKSVPCAGENSVESVKEMLAKLTNTPIKNDEKIELPPLPVRPPVLCAGCPHRASFYAVKVASKGKNAVFSGDIGCYTLGNAQPLDMVDTCLCMGAGITIAQGLHRADEKTVNFAFVGDSTFFASGITGVINAVYNQTDIVLIILDNSTTAMTGHQPHPGTAKTMMGNISDKINISEVLNALSVKSVVTVDPFGLDSAVEAVKNAMEVKGVSAVIFKSPCIAVSKPKPHFEVDHEKCTGCRKCINQLGCPAIACSDKKVKIEESLCFGCSLCSQLCPAKAIKIGGKNHD